MNGHRVGIIGSGAVAARHLQGYRNAGAEVVAISDVDPATLELRQAEWNISHGYSDYRELLDDPTIEAVSVCTPNAAHHGITIAAARAGKHVLCEKPISLSIDQAQEMIDVCEHSGVLLQVGHHLRSLDAAAKAKEIIDSGHLGRVTYARFRQAHDWGGATSVRGSFGSLASSGGGTLLDNGCHMFDLARYFCGDAVDVFARTATLKFDVEVEDTAVSSIGFASGAIGQVESAWTGTGWQEAFWVFGTEGSVECDNRVGASTLVHRFRGTAGVSWADTDVATYQLQGGQAHIAHVGNFLKSVEGKRPVVCTGHDGLEAVRLVLASYQSATSGQRVVLA